MISAALDAAPRVRHCTGRVDDERHRRHGLTPLSGELKAPADWTPPGPVAERYVQRKEKRPPTTRRDVLLHGLRRFVLISAGLGGGIALIAVLILWLGDASASRVFPLAFYLGGAMFGAAAVLGGTGVYEAEYWDRAEREQAFNMSFVYGAFGVALIGVGVLLDSVL